MSLRRCVAGISIIAAMALPSAVAAEVYEDGSSLYALCTESEIWQEAACIAFAIAVADVMLSSETPLFGHEACIPAKVSREQIKDTVVALLKDEPQLRQDYSAVSLVALALSRAFPCT